MREFLNKKLNGLELKTGEVSALETSLIEAKELHIATEKAKEIMQKAAQLSQRHLAEHLSTIVTQGIQAVIEKPYKFVCEFVERRGTNEADLYLTKDGEKFDILSGTGGGLADVCSFTLKIAYLLLSNVDKVLIIDEVSRHINSKHQRRKFAEVLHRLSEEFGIQMIIISTIPELAEVADKVFELKQISGETRIV